MIIRIIVCLMTLTFFCCKKPHIKNKLKYSEKYYAKYEQIKLIKLNEEQYKLGTINFLFTHIDALGNIFISDKKNKNFIEYDDNGNFIRMIGKKGHGPGEYSIPTFIETDSLNYRYLFDSEKFVTIKYDQENNYINEYSFLKGAPFPGQLKIYHTKKIISLFNYMSNSKFKEVALFHVLDDNFKIVKSIVIDYPDIFEKYNLYNIAMTSWDVNNKYIYNTFAVLPEIYKYDHTGRVLAILKVNTDHFNVINKKFVSSDYSLVKKIKYLNEFSMSYSLDVFNNNNSEYIFYCYFNTLVPKNEKINIFNARQLRKFYSSIIKTDGVQIKVSNGSELPGEPLFCTKDGKLYLLLNDEPENRQIGVYKIVIEKKAG